MKEPHDLSRIYRNDELTYSAYKRCRCGAGLAFPTACKDPYYFWGCGYIMSNNVKFRPVRQSMGPFDPGLLEDENGVVHDGGFSFVFHEIMKESVPSKSLGFITTRPNVVKSDVKSKQGCKKKGCK